MTPIEYDGAYNFQVSQSLHENFSYKPRYVPATIYDARVTTNGPLQYLMSAAINLFGLDLGRSIALGTIAGLMAVTIFLYSIHSFFLYCLLLLFWPNFVWIHVNFWGEAFSITTIIAGFIAWERWYSYVIVHKTSERAAHFHFYRSLYLLLNGLAFGFAMSTKLMAAPAILLLLFCLVVYKLSEKQETTHDILDPSLWVHLFLFPCGIAITIFILQFIISILHSGGYPGTIWPTLKIFVLSHVQQAEHTATMLKAMRQVQVDSIPSIIVLILLLLLLRKHIIFILPGIAITGLLFVGNFNIRRIMVLMLPLMLQAVKEICLHNSQKTRNTIANFWPILGSGIILSIGTIACNRPPVLAKIISKFDLEGAPPHQSCYPGKERKNYDMSLIPTLNSLPGPIFTSGWFQFPEISLRTTKVFYDRFAAVNSRLLHSDEVSFILFDSDGPEDKKTEQELCGTILYRDASLVLCQYRHQ